MLRKISLAAAALALCAALAPVQAFAQKKSNPKLELTIEKRGTITVELYQRDAPKTVAHMLDLVKKKFYDGILVHRVVPGFVVQAGDPQTKTVGVDGPGIGSGGSGAPVPFEKNERTHEPGTMAMALSAPRSATGDSQWFINLEPNHQLDGDYCVFGKVTKGMDIVKKMAKGDKIVSMKLAAPKK